MAKKKGAHLSSKEQYAAYKTQGRYTKNKRKKLEKHIKLHPNDAQTAAAFGKISESSIRKTPNSYVWGKRQQAYAEQLASLGYNGMAALGGKEEARLQQQVIGFGAKQILDIPAKERSEKPKK